MKVKVDQEKCIGCGACVAIAPNNFDFNDEGLSTVVGEEVTDETRNAVDACPVYAISIEEAVKESVEETTKEQTCKCSEGGECTCGDDCECGDDCTCGENCNCKHKCECGDECECGDDCECEHQCDCEHDCNCDHEKHNVDEEEAA